VIHFHSVHVFFNCCEETADDGGADQDADGAVEGHGWDIKAVIHSPRVFHRVNLLTHLLILSLEEIQNAF